MTKLTGKGLFTMDGSAIKSDDVTVSDSVSVNKNKKADKKVNKNVYKNESVDEHTDNSLSLSFTRKPRRRKPVPMTYRLYPETIEKIDDLAMKSGMYVSEFLQAVLDRVLDEIIIE